MPMDNRRAEKRFADKSEKDKEFKAGLPGEDDTPLPPPVEPVQVSKAPGRNDPCSCGSGKKYKKCCGNK